ncbi:R3H domain-containing nucleic acid-binding protein [Microbacterium sp. LX3-4]|uniref:R3H domain-containing nucleic acid-binding protein n=1 Tax=Microbacterium dauci TaxID=3048008 RepID=A0ABT6ZD29_9MICO|nr:R3H domain-containing nucleic acid-binding protein [Microbacterium sp. LX3-4]MDJ1114069.1 R3H domain-containing nucleic acid-binding protein [Microbacterium sp. LX3-4]
MVTNVEQSGDARVPASVEQLEQEGDIAADYLEGILDIADIDGDLAMDVRSGRAYVSVENDDPAALALLSDPDTVQALQELTRLAVQAKTGQFSRLILDIAGSRDARQDQLAALVDRAIARLDEGASQASLPAMSSYERKLIHDIVAERGLVSESYGEGATRHTVIRRG